MGFIMLWLLAAIPGLFFTSGVAFSFSLIWLPASGALLVASILWAFLAAAWVTFLPSALYRRTLAAMKLAENEAVNRSWARAFDGVSGTYPTPELRLMDDAAPVLLVFKLPLRAPVLVVSSGWLYSHGEEAFRQACKRAVARMQEPGLELWTCGAVMMSALQSGLSRAFSSLVLAPASEHTDGLRLSAVRLALSLPVFAWISWIRGVLRLEPLSSTGCTAESAVVDWMGRGRPTVAVLHQLLSLDAAPAERHARKSILSWIPGHW